MSDVPEGNQAHGLDFNEQEAVADAVLTLYVGNGVREGLSWRTLFTTQLVGLLLDEELVFFGGGEQNSNHVDSTLPFLFWRVSVGRRRSPPSGEPQVSRGDP
jgi:hypothetical protein